MSTSHYVRTLLVVVVLSLATAIGALGQTPVGEVMCACPGASKPLGNAANCEEACYGRRSSPNSNSSDTRARDEASVKEAEARAIAYEAARFSEWSRRLDVLLDQLRSYEVFGANDLYDMPAPASLNELIARIDRVYVETAFYKSKRYALYENNSAYLFSAPARLSTLRTQNRTLEMNLASAPERLRNLEAQRDQIVARAKVQEYLAWNFRNNVGVVEYDLRVARRSTIDPILDLLPADRKAAFREAAIRGEKLPGYAIQPLLEAPPAIAQIKPTIAVRPIPIQSFRRGSPFAGSIEAKLNAFADLKRVIDYVDEIIPSQEKEVAAFEQQEKDLRETHDSLWQRFQAYESPLERAEALIDDAERRLGYAQINQRISAENLLRLAAATILWNHIKENVVIPQIERVLEENGLLESVRGIAFMDKLRRRPQDLLPKIGPLKDLPRLIEVSKQIVMIEENWELFALAAADATGRIETAESDTLVVHIFDSLGKSGVEIMRTASGAMEGTQGKIARALMERAPEEN